MMKRLRARWPVGILVLFVLTALVALAGGWYLMFVSAWIVLLLVGVAYLLSIVGLRALHFERKPQALRAEVGSYFNERIVVENLSWIPKLWLEIEDQGQHPEHTASFVVSLGPWGRFVRPVHTLCQQRGVFQLGPVIAHSGDPFGLFRQHRQVDGVSTLVVYPIAVPLSAFGPIRGELSGGALQGERVQHTTTNVAGVREYRPGDTFNRIHWRTTARQRQLMVKEFELDPFADIWLVLDLDQQWMLGSGPESLEEYAVTICASLAKFFLDENRALGFASQGVRLTPDRGPRQLLKILEVLAYVRPKAGQPLAELLIGEQGRFSRADTVIVVTGARDDPWVPVMRGLSMRGVNGQVVLLEPSTFGRVPKSLDVLGAVAAARLPTYLVKRGESLQEALRAPVLGAPGAAGVPVRRPSLSSRR
ncbi:MAG: DUF58 domain-containing protein [Chloroflexi bacterium]|nr:DUF58 domain-containing protein [Chloroflexota bacterium]